MAKSYLMDFSHVMMMFSIVASRIHVIGFVLFAHIYEIGVFAITIMLVFVVGNIPSIYIVFILVIVLGSKIITIVHLYLTMSWAPLGILILDLMGWCFFRKMGWCF